MRVINGPRYAVVQNGLVIHRSESLALAEGAFNTALNTGNFLELTIRNSRDMDNVEIISDADTGVYA